MTRLAAAGMERKGFNMAAMFYCLDALQKFEGMSRDEVQTIAFDVALLGQRGLDIHDPEKKYRVKSLPDVYSGLQALCFMYDGFKIIDPSIDAGIDLEDEYTSAMEMHKGTTARESKTSPERSMWKRRWLTWSTVSNSRQESRSRSGSTRSPRHP